jgi:hypothetical protein
MINIFLVSNHISEELLANKKYITYYWRKRIKDGKKSKKEVKTCFYNFFNYIFQMNNTYFQEKAASKSKMKRKLSRELKEKKNQKKRY